MGAHRTNLVQCMEFYHLCFVFVFFPPKVVTLAPDSSQGNKPSTVAPEMVVFLVYTGKSLIQKTDVLDIATDLTQATIELSNDNEIIYIYIYM